MLRKGLIILVIALTLCTNSHAKRRILTLDELTESSQIIAWARLVSINWEDIDNCSWVFSLDETFKTDDPSKGNRRIEIIAKGIRREEEVYPKEIAEYIVFLKKTNNGHSNYSLGMERFWKIKRTITSHNEVIDIVESDFPAAEIPKELYSETELKSDLYLPQNDVSRRVRVIEFDKIKDWLRRKRVNISDPGAAADFAAQLANQKAKENWGVTPFKPEAYTAGFKDGRWFWGHLEPAGYMAIVSFKSDGTEAVVSVYHSHK